MFTTAATRRAWSAARGGRQRAGKSIASAYGAVKQEAGSDKGPVESTIDAGSRLAGVSREDAERYREKFEDYLRGVDSDVVDPDGITRDLEQLLEDPRAGWEALKDRFSRANRDTVKSLLTARGVDDDRAERIVGWAESAIESLSRRFSRTESPAHSMSSNELEMRAEGKLQRFLAQVDDPKLDYEELRDELELLFDDPRAGADSLIRRLKSLDRETLTAIMATRKGTTEEDARATLAALEEARDNVLDRMQRAKDEVERRLVAAKRKSLEAAEEARKTVSTAAWWAFGAAAVSGAAAAAGGLVAVFTGIG